MFTTLQIFFYLGPAGTPGTPATGGTGDLEDWMDQSQAMTLPLDPSVSPGSPVARYGANIVPARSHVRTVIR